MIESPRDQAGSATMSVPEYQRVVDHIIEQIESGQLRPGDKLDTIDRLAETLETGRTTIKTAQMVLRAQGWIVGKQGKAVYVADKPPIGREDHSA